MSYLFLTWVFDFFYLIFFLRTEKKDNVESVATEASENKDDDELTIDTEAPPAAGEWSQAIQEKNESTTHL